MYEDAEHEATGMIQTVTGKTFDSVVLRGKGPIVVEFMTYGCGHCQQIEPVLQEVARIVQQEEKIIRVNVALESELADRCEITGTPTLVMFLNGKIVGRAEGPKPALADMLVTVRSPYEV